MIAELKSGIKDELIWLSTPFVKLDKEADKQLLSTKGQIIKGLNDGISPKEFMTNIGQKIYVRKIAKQTIFDNKFIEYTGKKFEEEI